MIDATYVLPLRVDDDRPVHELATYVRRLGDAIAEVIVVDGSPREAVAAHRAEFGPNVVVMEPDEQTPNGKVGNVMTGVRRAAHERIVIADDDVRYTGEQLQMVVAALDTATVVRPQNYYDPLPWHARFDTARTLLNRMTGGDWVGTLAVRRTDLLAAGGYAGDVMFENLELVRTIEAHGGSEHLALDVIVRRLPPTAAHFRGQQIRQAYDELARPGRLAVSLAIAPALAAAGRRRAWPLIAGFTAGSALLAELGRWRAGGRSVFPLSASLLAPVWLAWRSLCSWAALGARLRGGTRYRDGRILRAATPMAEMRRRAQEQGSVVPPPGVIPADGTSQGHPDGAPEPRLRPRPPAPASR